MLTVLEWVLVMLGCAVTVLSILAAELLSKVLDMLHLVTATTSVAATLNGMGVAIGEGPSSAAVMVLLTVAIVAVTGPVVSAATARMSAQRDHTIADEPPL